MRIHSFFIVISCAFLFISNPALANESNESFCHLHPPGAEITEDLSKLLKFNSSRDCLRENRQRYSAEGRCHCSFSLFSNRKRLPFNRNDTEQDEREDNPLQ